MARWPQKRCSPSEPSPGIPCTNRDLLVAALCRFFSIFVDVLNHALKDEQVRATMAGELDAIAVIPFDWAAKDFSTIDNDRHRRMGMHLLDPKEVLCRGKLPGARLPPREPTVLFTAVSTPLLHALT